MSAIELLLDTNMLPFTGALALVAGFLVMELLMSLVGASMMGDSADGVDFDAPDGADAFDADAGFDADAALDPDAALDADAAMDADGIELDGAEGADAVGVAGWLGFGQVPFILWLSGLLTAFGLVGYVVQLGATTVFGGSLGWPYAAALALFPSLRIGGWFARMLGRLVPKTETSAINRRSLGGRRGVIVQGTARRGKPAQARVRDGYGNWHYVRVEPVDDDVAIPARCEVMIRDGRGPILLAIPLDDTAK